jgi:hypothetical protein
MEIRLAWGKKLTTFCVPSRTFRIDSARHPGRPAGPVGGPGPPFSGARHTDKRASPRASGLPDQGLRRWPPDWRPSSFLATRVRMPRACLGAGLRSPVTPVLVTSWQPRDPKQSPASASSLPVLMAEGSPGTTTTRRGRSGNQPKWLKLGWSVAGSVRSDTARMDFKSPASASFATAP